MPLIQPRLCAWCHEPFTPLRKRQQNCGPVCSRKSSGAKSKGVLPKALAARQAKLNAAVETKVAGMTPAAAYRFGFRRGYMRGYYDLERSSSMPTTTAGKLAALLRISREVQ